MLTYKVRDGVRRRGPVTRWLIMGVVVVAVGALLLACSPSGSENAPSDHKGGARVSFERESFDFGDVAFGQEVKADFKLRNVGDQPLVIKDVTLRTVKGC